MYGVEGRWMLSLAFIYPSCCDSISLTLLVILLRQSNGRDRYHTEEVKHLPLLPPLLPFHFALAVAQTDMLTSHQARSQKQQQK